jgi:hypothetical protein
LTDPYTRLPWRNRATSWVSLRNLCALNHSMKGDACRRCTSVATTTKAQRSPNHNEITPARGVTFAGPHHEIYLSDARKTPPEKLRKILRQPVKSAG